MFYNIVHSSEFKGDSDIKKTGGNKLKPPRFLIELTLFSARKVSIIRRAGFAKAVSKYFFYCCFNKSNTC